MFNLNLKKYFFIAFILLTLIFVLSLIIIVQNCRKQTDRSKVEIPKASKNLETLPNFESKKDLENGNIEYAYASEDPYRDDLVITSGEKIVYERTLTVKDNQALPKLDEFTEEYGTPDQELFGPEYYGAPFKTYIYLSKGVAFVANSATLEVREIHRFTPTNLEDYLAKWGQDLSTTQQPDDHP